MKIFTVIFLFLTISCGADPDDFKVQESDGCRSDDLECVENLNQVEEGKGSEPQSDQEDHGPVEESREGDHEDGSITVESEVNVKTKVVIGDNDIEPEDPAVEPDVDNSEDCQAGRLCRGVTKQEVLDLLGEPVVLNKKGAVETWQWEEWSLEGPVCGSFTCTIEFRDGLLYDQEDIAADWLDLANF